MLIRKNLAAGPAASACTSGTLPSPFFQVSIRNFSTYNKRYCCPWFDSATILPLAHAVYAPDGSRWLFT